MLFALLDRWLSPPPDPRKVGWLGDYCYAHRGLHDAGVPENSRSAFERAAMSGYGIELDVQRSGDGLPVVFHDETLDRMTVESGDLSRRNAAQLGAIRLAGTSQTIPTLRQVLADVAGRVPLLIEIKSGPDTRIAALCLAVRRVLEGYTGLHAVMSFDPRVSHWYALHSPHTVRGLSITEGEDRALPGKVRRRLALWHAQPDFLCYDVRDLPSRFAAAQRSRGLPLVTWTVTSVEHGERAAEHADADIFEGAVRPMRKVAGQA
ncbi:glycerophosphodiester phosphodiesterase family protein [Novosphingobium album (ex Hu et al. 2023)]|uniref:Glycerophosphodiester phosphodiesterase n=1 Tax=Novosphingobium album (ex Hu et al. 2023) TaxID=2930093 RepID=A0ABT0B0W3_9SPHN|nr:glycerophosphodiester phosphodiesterase family protein [Novosphingobium album (ex Hu et al. 2023)]MCJ2178655.1 glycerophosphodiester phosphodiesterase [Novosphingobium album (ex Hu et al. 2023)]